MEYLTMRQSQIWGFARGGLSESRISKKLGISRQSVHIMLNTARSKMLDALDTAAQSNRIQVRHMDVDKGILVGYSPELNHKVIITYSARNGIRIWYAHNEECQQCKFDRSWLKIVMEEAEERGITLTSKELRLSPPELAKVVFEKMLPEIDL